MLFIVQYILIQAMIFTRNGGKSNPTRGRLLLGATGGIIPGLPGSGSDGGSIPNPPLPPQERARAQSPFIPTLSFRQAKPLRHRSHYHMEEGQDSSNHPE